MAVNSTTHPQLTHHTQTTPLNSQPAYSAQQLAALSIIPPGIIHFKLTTDPTLLRVGHVHSDFLKVHGSDFFCQIVHITPK